MSKEYLIAVDMEGVHDVMGEPYNVSVRPIGVDTKQYATAVASATKEVNVAINALFESGADADCDFVIGVTAEPALRKARIMERDGLTEEYAVLRIEAGKPDAWYREKCDFMIENNHAPEETISAALDIYNTCSI